MITRRVLLRDGALTALGLSMVPGFLSRTALAAAPESRHRKVLVALFQRGGADGLNIVVPFGEKSYYDYRPTIAIRPPGPQPGSALDLDGTFGLHPALQPLLPLYQKGELGIITAVGTPDSSRSHFQAQDLMEAGVTDPKRVSTGWLNRYFQATVDPRPSPFRGTALGTTLPRSLRGQAPAIALGNVRQLGGNPVSDIFQTQYSAETNTLLSGTARDMFQAIELLKKAAPDKQKPAEGVTYPNGPIARNLQQIAQLIKADVGLQVAFLDVGGWDHHVDEGTVDGRMAQLLRPLGAALAAFHKDLGDRMEDVVVLTMSEFGRTARENGNRGTDHGCANVMFALGGPVKGGKIYGTWPGLAPEQLNENRDLARTTDFRDVFAEVLVQHLGCEKPATVFPDFTVDPKRFTGFLGAASGRTTELSQEDQRRRR